MADLTVDVAVLQESERALSLLKRELDSIEGRRDDTRHVWGHDGLRHAMHVFASNMRHRREELSRKMQDNGEKVAATLEAFRIADEELARGLERSIGIDPGARP